MVTRRAHDTTCEEDVLLSGIDDEDICKGSRLLELARSSENSQ